MLSSTPVRMQASERGERGERERETSKMIGRMGETEDKTVGKSTSKSEETIGV